MKPILAMLNIFIDPKEAVKGFDSKWAWVWPFLIVSAVAGAAGWFLIPITLQAMQYDPPRGMDAEQLRKAMPNILMMSKITASLSPISTAIMTLMMAGLIAGACAVMDIKASFLQLFTLVAHCSLITSLQVVASCFVLNLKRDEIQSLKQLAPGFGLDLLLSENANKQLTAILNYFTIFQIWYLVILALGLAFLANTTKGKAFAAITPVWMVGVIMRVGFSFFR